MRAARRVSWTAKVLTVALAIFIGYPLVEAFADAGPHRIQQRGGVWVCDLRTLSGFEFDQVHGQTQDIPQEIRALDGKPVSVVGQMCAPFAVDGRIRDFDLVYSIGGCCFAGPPKVQHIVKARMRDGRSVQYNTGRVKVTGLLHVGVQRDGEAIDSIYRLDVDSVEAE